MTGSWQGEYRKAGRKPPAGRDGDAGGPPAEPKPVDGEGCPVTALGRRGGYYWFFSPSGEERKLHYRQLYKREGLEDLFEGRLGWLYANFKPAEGGLDVFKAGRWLLRACVGAGYFDDSMQRQNPEREMAGNGGKSE